MKSTIAYNTLQMLLTLNSGSLFTTVQEHIRCESAYDKSTPEVTPALTLDRSKTCVDVSDTARVTFLATHS
jgi:hypothetical protein